MSAFVCAIDTIVSNKIGTVNDIGKDVSLSESYTVVQESFFCQRVKHCRHFAVVFFLKKHQFKK